MESLSEVVECQDCRFYMKRDEKHGICDIHKMKVDAGDACAKGKNSEGIPTIDANFGNMFNRGY